MYRCCHIIICQLTTFIYEKDINAFHALYAAITCQRFRRKYTAFVCHCLLLNLDIVWNLCAPFCVSALFCNDSSNNPAFLSVTMETHIPLYHQIQDYLFYNRKYFVHESVKCQVHDVNATILPFSCIHLPMNIIDDITSDMYLNGFNHDFNRFV